MNSNNPPVPHSALLTTITSNNDSHAQYILKHSQQLSNTNQAIQYTSLWNQTENSDLIIKKLSNAKLLQNFQLQKEKIQSLQTTLQPLDQINSRLLRYSKEQNTIQNKLNEIILEYHILNERHQNNKRNTPIIPQESIQLQRTSNKIAPDNSFSNLSCLGNLHSTRRPIVTLPTMPSILSFASGNNLRHLSSTQQQHTDHLTFSPTQSPQTNDDDTKPKGRPSVFPQKLHQMLCDLEKQPGGTEIASFLPHGHAFIIHRPKQLIDQVIPNYFNLTSITSFRRQLRLYNFHHISTGPDTGAYYHEFFIRGQPLLCSSIKRRKHQTNQETNV